MVYARTGSAGSRVTPDDVRRAEADGVFGEGRWLHLTGITPALSDTAREATALALDVAKESKMTVSFDVNLRRRLWSDDVAGPVLRPLAERSDVVLGSPDELAVLTGTSDTDPAALAKAVLDLGPSLAVVKLGADGALALERGGEPVSSPARAIPTVVDPVGAGRRVLCRVHRRPPRGRRPRHGPPKRERVRGRGGRGGRRPRRAADAGSSSPG